MGLKSGDLKDLVYNILEIDSFASKMGDDKNIITISFSVKDKPPADDLVKFLEGGYSFILDADVTSGEQSDGTYKVFVEIERSKDCNNQIMEIINGVGNLTHIDDFKFRYYKNWKSKPLTIENLEETVPTDPDKYGINVNESNLDNYKNFFNRSYVDQIDLLDDILTIKKPFADPLQFEFIEFGDKQTVLQEINETFNTQDFAEIIFLSKYIGDYNITKYGHKLTFENAGKTLVLKRIAV